MVCPPCECSIADISAGVCVPYDNVDITIFRLESLVLNTYNILGAYMNNCVLFIKHNNFFHDELYLYS